VVGPDRRRNEQNLWLSYWAVLVVARPVVDRLVAPACSVCVGLVLRLFHLGPLAVVVRPVLRLLLGVALWWPVPAEGDLVGDRDRPRTCAAEILLSGLAGPVSDALATPAARRALAAVGAPLPLPRRRSQVEGGARGGLRRTSVIESPVPDERERDAAAHERELATVAAVAEASARAVARAKANDSKRARREVRAAARARGSEVESSDEESEGRDGDNDPDDRGAASTGGASSTKRAAMVDFWVADAATGGMSGSGWSGVDKGAENEPPGGGGGGGTTTSLAAAVLATTAATKLVRRHDLRARGLRHLPAVRGLATPLKGDNQGGQPRGDLHRGGMSRGEANTASVEEAGLRAWYRDQERSGADRSNERW